MGMTVGAMITFSLPDDSPALPVLVLFNALLLVFRATSNATIQSLVPNEHRGRIASLSMIRADIAGELGVLAGYAAALLVLAVLTLRRI